MSEVNLGLLTFDKSPLEQVVVCEERRWVINRRHPLVAVTLERFESDPLWVTFLASAAYTAINCRLVKVTDADEAQFHYQLAQLVVSGFAGSRKA